MSIEAMKLALEALDELFNTKSYWWQEVDDGTHLKLDAAKKDLRQAIEQAEQAGAKCTRCGEPAGVHTSSYWCDGQPPRQPWVGLTSVDWNDFNAIKSNDPQYVVAWAEIKLKEKNT